MAPVDTTPPEDSAGRRVVFLLDCDNTLFDTDTFVADVAARLRAILGDALTQRFFLAFERWRQDPATRDQHLDFDQALARGLDDLGVAPEANLRVRAALITEYSYPARVYPATLATLRHLATLGTPVIVSDGDQAFQPMKIERSGLAAAVAGQVAIYHHKEDHLPEIMARWPAPFYVAVEEASLSWPRSSGHCPSASSRCMCCKAARPTSESQ